MSFGTKREHALIIVAYMKGRVEADRPLPSVTEMRDLAEDIAIFCDERPPGYSKGMMLLRGKSLCNECGNQKHTVVCFDVKSEGTVGWCVCVDCLNDVIGHDSRS